MILKDKWWLTILLWTWICISNLFKKIKRHLKVAKYAIAFIISSQHIFETTWIVRVSVHFFKEKIKFTPWLPSYHKSKQNIHVMLYQFNVKKQAQLCNKLRLRRHLLHKRCAWPRRLALAGPSARRGFPLFSCFNIEPCNDIFNYLII